MAVTGARLAWSPRPTATPPASWRTTGRACPTSATSPPWTGRGAACRPGQRRVAVPGHLLRRPGAGITEGTRSGLWLHIADGLRHLRPSYVYLENVAALRTRGLGKVLGDLAALGYDAQWTCLRAADAGAPHRRDRLLILAVRPGEAGRLAAAADPGRRELRRRGIPADLAGPPGPAEEARPNGNGIGTPLPAAIALLPTPMAGDFGADKAAGPVRPSGAKRQTGPPDVIIHRLASQDCPSGTGEPGQGRLLPTPDTGCSPNGHGRRGGRPGNGHQSGHGLDVAATALSHAPGSRACVSLVAWGEYEPAIRRWEHVLAHPAPPPAEPGPSGRPRLSAAFAEWMMGLAPGFVTGVPGIPPHPPAEDHRQRRRPPAGRPRPPAADQCRRHPGRARRRHAGRRMNRPVPGPSAPHGRAPCPPGTTPALASRRPVWPRQPHGPPGGPLHPVPSRGVPPCPVRRQRKRTSRSPRADCREQRHLRRIPPDERNHAWPGSSLGTPPATRLRPTTPGRWKTPTANPDPARRNSRTRSPPCPVPAAWAAGSCPPPATACAAARPARPHRARHARPGTRRCGQGGC